MNNSLVKFLIKMLAMSATYFVTFILIIIIIHDVLKSDFLEPSAGMEMTLFLSFYIFLPFAVFINLLDKNQKWRLISPAILCIVFFIINNGGISRYHSRMLVPTISFLAAVYSIELIRTVKNRLTRRTQRNKKTANML